MAQARDGLRARDLSALGAAAALVLLAGTSCRAPRAGGRAPSGEAAELGAVLRAENQRQWTVDRALEEAHRAGD